MKAIRIIAIVLMLVAAGCGSSADEAIRVSSADAGSSSAAAAGSDQEQNVAGVTGAADDSAVDERGGENEEAGAGTAGATEPDEGDGSARSEPEADGAEVTTVASGFLAQASDATVEASTARFEGRLSVTAAPGSEPDGSFELTLSGAYDLNADATDIEIDLSGLTGALGAEATPAEADMMASMFAEPVQLRTIGETAWVRWGLLTSMFGATTEGGGTAWIETEVSEAASMTGEFGVDSPESPTDLLELLSELDATVAEVGRETVRGVETTHYLATIDLEAASSTLTPEERAELEAELPDGISGELPVDIWIDDNDLVRRLVVELEDLEAMGLEDAGEAGAFGSVLIEFEIFDVGEPIDISPPPAGDVITSDDLGFGFDGDF